MEIKAELSKALNIRYVKLHFTLMFSEPARMPKNKTSAIRGGMGEMLLRANCIRDRKCENCDFYSECIVQRTMYSQFSIKPEFVTTGDSIGYVIECENLEEKFKAGDTLQFNLILFGKTIVYFNQYMQALFALGRVGIGRYQAKFQIVSVTNTKNHPILDGDNIYMEYYMILTVENYVRYRFKELEQQGMEGILNFKTPLTVKYKAEWIQEFHMEAILNAIRRRIFMLDCFEGIETDMDEIYEMVQIPHIVCQESRFVGIERYSARQDRKMVLRGLEGYAELDHIPIDILPLLLAGELIHIGKNTSFGFGRYRLK